MQNQRPHQNRVSAKSSTRNGGFFRTNLNLRVRKNSISMRAWNHSKGAILFSAIVEVNSDGEHLLQNRDRRPNMNDTGLVRPGSPTLDVEFFANGNHTILVPSYLPVRFWIFVEENSPYCETLMPKHGCKGPPHLIRSRDGSHDRIGQEVANSMLTGVKFRFQSS